MTLSATKLRAIVNLLSDERQAHAAAHILSREAGEQGVLVADLVSRALGSDAPPPAPVTPFDEDDGVSSIGKRINSEYWGLRSDVIYQTDRAWLVAGPDGNEIWLPKSQCEHKGEDAQGRAILIIPMWLARKTGLRR